MIESKRTHAEISCDSCPHQEEFDLSGYQDRRLAWSDMLKMLKASGWKIVKCGIEWLHHCPVCMAKDKAAFTMKFTGEK